MKPSNWTKKVAIGLVLALGLSSGGCYGPFKLTKKVHHWNGSFENKWVGEVVFIGLLVIPIYSLSMLGDGLIFNSIEFWGGTNPIDDGDMKAK